MYYKSKYDSPIGVLTIICDESNILSVTMDTQLISPKYSTCSEKFTPLLSAASHWLNDYFSGNHPNIDTLPLKPEGTPFQQLVWELLCSIPYSCTVTYGQIARQAAQIFGKSKISAQAIGQAVGANPISIIIPCHRVIGANHKLTGYAGGLDKKLWLLSHECIKI